MWNSARAHRRSGYWIGLALTVVLAASCSSRPPQQRPTGVAYAGPATLNLRKDLASKSPVVGTAIHGEQLDILDTRRRFVKVRTRQGVVGWTDTNLLLTQQQMDDLRRLAESANKTPSQGVATVFEAVNMHAEPNRQSPSFFQIPEAGKVDVIGHQAAPRVQPPPAKPLPVRRAAPSKKAKGKDGKQRVAPLLPPPPPPGPPPNWEQLSRPRASDIPGLTAAQLPPVALDDWNLVRTHDGKVGWVLARMLSMAIPDEVAQYAEGHRITAYLPLGDVKDQNAVKHNWLWTTISNGQHSFEFDSFRVFVWSIRRHRYETAYIERNVSGHYPVETQAIPGQEEKTFSLVLEEKDAKLYKRTYGFSGYRVRMISKTPYQPVPSLPAIHFDPSPAQVSEGSGGWRQKLSDWRKRWLGR